MNRIINIALFLILVSFSAVAQNKKDSTGNNQPDLYKENYNLRNEIKAKDKQIEAKDKQIEGLNEQIEKLKAELQTLKDNARTSVLKKEIEDLKQQIEDLCADTARLNVSVESLKKQNKELSDKKKKDKDTKTADLERKIAEMEAELNTLHHIKQIYLKQKVDNLSSDFLDKPLSQIDLAELENAQKEFAQFASEDKSIATAANQLSALKTDYQIYSEAVTAVNSPYNAAIINKIKNPLFKLYEKTPDTPKSNPGDKNKKEEIYALYWQLNNYESKISIFKELLTIVDRRISNNQGEEWDYANNEINKLEKEKQSVTSVCAIPYLKTLYDDYYQKLEGRYNPKAVRKVSDSEYKAIHDAITNLKID